MNRKQIAEAMRNQNGSFTDAIKLGQQLHKEHGIEIPEWIDKHEYDFDPSSDYHEWVEELTNDS